MGKSMSTAKQINRSTIVKVAKEQTSQSKPNQQSIRTLQPSQPNTAYLEKVNAMDTAFNDRLKQVFVTSVDKNPNMDLPKDRAMPKDRTTPYALTPHPQTADDRKPNSLLVDDIKMLLLNYKENPKKWTLEYIAARFNITKEIAEKLVKNYSTLQTYYAQATSESDKYLKHEEQPKNKITYKTTGFEVEDILTAGVERKYKTKEEIQAEFEFQPKDK